jgi:hypothetical protein
MQDDDEDDTDQQRRDDDDIAKTGSKSLAERQSEHLLKLILLQSTNSAAWIKYLIAVQGGLGVGYVFSLKAVAENASPSRQVGVAFCILLALCGLTTAFVISRIVARQYRWAAWFISQYRKLADGPVSVFPEGINLDAVPAGFIATNVRYFCELLMLLWLLSIVIAVWGANLR